MIAFVSSKNTQCTTEVATTVHCCRMYTPYVVYCSLQNFYCNICSMCDCLLAGICFYLI